MNQYLYLSATPESLVASMLPPEEFGNYLAVGTKKRTRGQAIFFEVDMGKMKNLPEGYLKEKLVPYKDGEPKRSVYVSIYRVLENTPLEALKNLYLVTDDGKVLELEEDEYLVKDQNISHLYQQINPLGTRVASKLDPLDFIRFLTDTRKPVSVPRIFFAEMKLNELAGDPSAPLHNLPYKNPDHLRDCLERLQAAEGRQTKTVIRHFRGELSYRCIENGFFIGSGSDYLYYPFPGIEQLEGEYYSWWRSALTQCF